MAILEDWENGSTSLDKYGGDTGEFDVQQTTVYEGSYAAINTGSFNSDNFIVDTGTTVQQGDTLTGWVNISSTNYGGGIVFGAQSESAPPDCYFVTIGSNLEIDIVSGGSISELAKTSASISTGVWYQLEADWASDGTITATLYDSSGSQVAQVSTTDTSYTSGGWGWYGAYSNSESYYDLYETSGTVIDASATAAGVATLTASAGFQREASATATGVATLTASAGFQREASATATGAATLTGAADVYVKGGATLAAEAVATASPAVTYGPPAALTAGASLTAQHRRQRSVFGMAAGTGTFSGHAVRDKEAGGLVTSTATMDASSTRAVGATGLVTGGSHLRGRPTWRTVVGVGGTLTTAGVVTAHGEPLLRPAMYAPTLTTAPGELTPRFAIDLYDDTAQPYDASVVESATLTIDHEPTGATLIDGEPMSVSPGDGVARAEYSFSEGEAFELERVGGHTASVTVTADGETQSVPARGPVAIRAGDTPGYQQLSLDGAGIERGLAARETDRTSTMAAFDSVDVTTADVGEAMLGESTFTGDVTMDAASLVGDDADLTLDTQPTISGKTSGVDPLHITDAAGTSVLEAHEGGDVDIGRNLAVASGLTVDADASISGALGVVGSGAEAATFGGGDHASHYIRLRDSEHGGMIGYHDGTSGVLIQTASGSASKSFEVRTNSGSDAFGNGPLALHIDGSTNDVDIPSGVLSEQGNRVATRNWTETADVTAGGSWTFNSNVSLGGNILGDVSNVRPAADSNLVFNLRGGTNTNRVTVYDNSTGNRVFNAWQNGNVSVPNGQLSEQGNRVATRTWTDSNYNNYTDADAVNAVEGTSLLTLNQLEIGTNLASSDTDLKLNANANIASDSSIYHLVGDGSNGGMKFGFGDTIRSGNETYSLSIQAGGTVNATQGPLQENGARVATRTWTNNNADVPNADDATMWDGYERYISSSAPSTSNPYIRFEPK